MGVFLSSTPEMASSLVTGAKAFALIGEKIVNSSLYLMSCEVERYSIVNTNYVITVDSTHTQFE